MTAFLVQLLLIKAPRNILGIAHEFRADDPEQVLLSVCKAGTMSMLPFRRTNIFRQMPSVSRKPGGHDSIDLLEQMMRHLFLEKTWEGPLCRDSGTGPVSYARRLSVNRSHHWRSLPPRRDLFLPGRLEIKRGKFPRSASSRARYSAGRTTSRRESPSSGGAALHGRRGFPVALAATFRRDADPADYFTLLRASATEERCCLSVGSVLAAQALISGSSPDAASFSNALMLC
jgi:hypothetical protein